ncbi:MAG: hypothetical protein Q9M97_03645 [Candidatus Gracilibacteria bacterium]|nr:hypothetical protein [Candidatus Gracilibacteria bacterium]
MKKIIVLVLLSLVLTSCFGDSKEVIDAKKDLGIIEKTVEDLEEDKIEKLSNDLSEDPRISITQISGEDIFKIGGFKNIVILKTEIQKLLV